MASVKEFKSEDFITKLTTWGKTFLGKPLHFAPSFKYSSDYKTCAICSEDYKEDENLTRLHDCRHVFHLNCFTKWQCKDKTPLDLILANEATIPSSCPLCRKAVK
jgi:hypothetical protein